MQTSKAARGTLCGDRYTRPHLRPQGKSQGSLKISQTTVMVIQRQRLPPQGNKWELTSYCRSVTFHVGDL